MTRKKSTTTSKLTHEEFTRRAIERLREGTNLGIHAVYSGFNEAFRDYFGEDPVASVKKLVEEGKFATRPCRGGVLIFNAHEAPKPNPTPSATLSKILK